MPVEGSGVFGMKKQLGKDRLGKVLGSLFAFQRSEIRPSEPLPHKNVITHHRKKNNNDNMNK
jgi:hypothetical protein